jgi:hypothetical protein
MVLKLFIYAVFTILLGSLAYGALSFYQEHTFLSNEDILLFLEEINKKIYEAFQQGYAVGKDACQRTL